MLHLASRGFRAIAHDRRGHGRSGQPWHGNDMDQYADDLAVLIEELDLRRAALVGIGAGAGEVARHVGRHGTGRVAKLALVAAPDPAGVPAPVHAGLRAASLANRGRLYRELAAGPFYGFNRPGAVADPALVDAFWLQGMMAGHKNALDGIAAFSATDFTADLAAIDVPTLVVHGDDDQIVPLDAGGRAAARLVRGAVLKIYPAAPHGLTETHADRLGADLLAFLTS